MSVATSTLRQNAFGKVFSLLSTNIATSTAKITNAYPKDNNTFPIVVVNPVNVRAEDLTHGSVANVKRRYNCELTIEVFTSKAKDLDSICDTISNLLLTTQTDADLHNVNVEDGTADYTFVNNNTVRMKPLAVSFNLGR